MAKTLDTELLGLTHAQLLAAPDNLRGTLTDVSELADSIAQIGVLQPLRVHPHPTAKGKWEIIAGHRRHAAIGVLLEDGRWKKTDVIPCVTAPGAGEDQARLQAMLIENLQRVDLDPIEEANGYARLHSEFGHSVRSIAELVGVSKSVVSARQALLKLPAVAQRMVSEGKLPIELAGQMTRLSAETVEKLVQHGPPNEYTVKSAVSAMERAAFVKTARAAVAAVDLEWFDGASWQLQKDHETRNYSITPGELRKILLPADTTGWKVTCDDYRQRLTVWSPRPGAATTTGSAKISASFDTDPIARLTVDVNDRNTRRRHDHNRAWEAYRTAAREAHVAIAREIAKDKATVAASAILHLCHLDAEDGYEHSEQLGYQYDPDGDSDTNLAAWMAWLGESGNQIALAALMMIAGEYRVDGETPVTKSAAELLDRDLGPEPDRWPGNDDIPDGHRAALAWYQALPDDHPSKADGIATFTRLITDDPDHADTYGHATPDDDLDTDDSTGNDRPCQCGNPTAYGEHNQDECFLDDEDGE